MSASHVSLSWLFCGPAGPALVSFNEGKLPTLTQKSGAAERGDATPRIVRRVVRRVPAVVPSRARDLRLRLTIPSWESPRTPQDRAVRAAYETVLL